MGTEVLLPQDCLPMRPRQSSIPNPSTAPKLFRKAQLPEARRRRDGLPKLAKPKRQQKQLLVGRVTILKRGEPIGGAAARKDGKGEGGGDLVRGAEFIGEVCLEWETAVTPKQIRAVPIRRDDAGVGEDGYAGSAVSMSPSPRSLPLPSFSRGQSCSAAAAAAFDPSATVGLRRLLRLD